jgi:hypothetical protein
VQEMGEGGGEEEKKMHIKSELLYNISFLML